MYIKIITDTDDVVDGRKSSIDATCECEGYRLEMTEGGHRLLTLEPSSRCFDLDPSRTEVYIMNDQGVTIDSYVWRTK